MDTRSGRISDIEALTKGMTKAEIDKFIVPINPSDLPKKYQNELMDDGATQLKPRTRCPCGSGRRFKSCCMNLDWKEFDKKSRKAHKEYRQANRKSKS